jgi:hypothetical protein
MAEYKPDVVVDCWNLLACIAANAAGIPVAALLQVDVHPLSRGFIWLIAFYRINLASYKCPRSVVFCPALPRTDTGKLSRAQVRELYAAPLAIIDLKGGSAGSRSKVRPNSYLPGSTPHEVAIQA